MKTQLSKISRNSLITNNKKAKTFDELPDYSKNALTNETSMINFVRHDKDIAESIDISIFVEQILSKNPIAINAAIALLSMKSYRKRLEVNQNEFNKLLTNKELLKSLEWLEGIAKYYNEREIEKIIQQNISETETIDEVERKSELIPAIRLIRIPPKQNENNNKIISNLFNNENPNKEANLEYFLTNSKASTNYLTSMNVQDMFILAQGKKILQLCWKLAKNRISLLKNYFHYQCGSDVRLNDKIKKNFTEVGSPHITEFLIYKPTELAGQLLKVDGKTDLEMFTDYLKSSYDPKRLLKAYGDLITKNNAQKIVEIKTIKNVSQVHLRTDSTINFMTDFHLYIKHNSKLLIKSLGKHNENILKHFNIWPHTQERNELLAMHLKENPSICKSICNSDPMRFVSLLKLTNDPVDILDRLKSTIKSESRPEVLFNSVLEIAKYVEKNPEYQENFNKLLSMNVRPIIGPSIKTIVVQFFMTKLNTESDLVEILRNKNLYKLFKFTDKQLQLIAEQLIQPVSHKVMAENHFSDLNLDVAHPDLKKKLNKDSIYYLLQTISGSKEERAQILNEAIFYNDAGSEKAKDLIKDYNKAKFLYPVGILYDLADDDLKNFETYFKAELEKISDIDTLDALKGKFSLQKGSVNLGLLIDNAKEMLNKNILLQALNQPLPQSAATLYNLSKKDSVRQLITPVNLNITQEEIDKRLFYGAICAGDIPLDRELSEQESLLFLNDFVDDKSLFIKFAPIIKELVFLNQNNVKLTNKIIDKLSESKKVAILMDERCTTKFISDNPQLFNIKKQHHITSLKESIKTNASFLSKIILSSNSDVVKKVDDLFRMKNYKLYLIILKNNLIFTSMQVEAKNRFFSNLVPLLNEPSFLKELMLDSNKQAAISIIESGHVELCLAFWQAVESKPVLVGHVLEKIVNHDDFNKNATVIKKFLDKFPTHSSVKNVSDHAQVKLLRKQTTHLNNTNINQNEIDNILSETTISAQYSFNYVEDIYKFVSANRNKKLNVLHEELKNINKDLLMAAWDKLHEVDYTVQTKLTDLNEEYKLFSNNSKSLSAKEKYTDNLISKFQDQNQQSEMCENLQTITNNYVKARSSTLDQNKMPHMGFLNKIIKPTIDQSKIEDYFKRRQTDIESNKVDEKNKKCVWIAVRAVESQMKFIEIIQENNPLNKQSLSEEALAKFTKDNNEKLNMVLNRVIAQALKYKKNGHNILAKRYYYDIIKCCDQYKQTEPSLYFKSLINLIDLLILENSNENKSEIKNLFNQLFSTKLFSEEQIHNHIDSIPVEWLASIDITNALLTDFNTDNHNLFILDYYKRVVSSKSLTDKASDNVKIINTHLSINLFTDKFEEIKLTHDNHDKLVNLLKEIYKANSNILLESNLKFDFKTVIATTDENLDIILFFLRNKKLCLSWFNEENNIEPLYSLARLNEVIQFALTCYVHFENKINNDLLLQPAVKQVNAHVDVQLDLSENIASQLDIAPPPSAPLTPPPPPPPSAPPIPPPPPPSNFVPLSSTKRPKNLKSNDSAKTQKSTTNSASALMEELKNGPKILKSATQRLPQQKKTASGNGLADAAAEGVRQRNAKTWRELFFIDDNPSPCGSEILTCFGVKEEKNIEQAVKNCLVGEFRGIKPNSTEDSILDSLYNNIDIMDFIVKKENMEQSVIKKEDLRPVASEMLKLWKPKFQSRPVNRSPIVPKALRVLSESQADAFLGSKADAFLDRIKIKTFLSIGSDVVFDTNIFKNIYKNYIDILNNKGKQPRDLLRNNLIKFLEDSITEKGRQNLINDHNRDSKKPTPEQAIQNKADLIFERIDEEEKRKKELSLKPTNAKDEIESEIRKYHQLIKIKLEDYYINGLDKSDKCIFSKNQLFEVITEKNTAAFMNLEEILKEMLQKFESNRKIYKNECLEEVCKNVPINKEQLEKYFIEHIWKPITTYAESQKKNHLIADVRVLEKNLILFSAKDIKKGTEVTLSQPVCKNL